MSWLALPVGLFSPGPDCSSSRQFIALAISEAFAGSDVSGLKCTAVKTEDEKHWIINGTKK